MEPLSAALEQQRKLDGIEPGEPLEEGQEVVENISDDKLKQYKLLLAAIEERKNTPPPPPRKRSNDFYQNWFYQETQRFNRQQKCPHLKGTIGVPSPMSRDYNVSTHTFPTGETRIKCLSGCGWEVWNRPGWYFKWAVGMHMVKNSSNFPSASQHFHNENTIPFTPTKTLGRTFTSYWDWLPRILGDDESPIRGLKVNRK